MALTRFTGGNANNSSHAPLPARVPAQETAVERRKKDAQMTLKIDVPPITMARRRMREGGLVEFGAQVRQGRDAIMAELDRALSGEESKALWADLESAALRVSRARASYEEMEKKEKELLALKAELEAAALMEAELAQADAQVEKLEAEVAAAEQAARAAGAALIEARAGGGFRTSSAGSGEQTAGKWAVSTGTIDDDKERVESAKAATVAAVAGTVAGLPFLLSQRIQEGGTGLSFLVAAAALAATCALFGVTYRYIVRKDMGNIHLKAGAVGAFGLARGLAQVDSTFSLVSAGSANNGLSDDVMGSMTDGALVPVALSLLEAGEGVLVLALTATALEYCLQTGFLSTFPAETSSASDSSPK
ncbi:unnamed protein product [Closterium sp. NIES-64]|nr:unnamed protein product [Closterium sp. NIES-64]